MPENQLIDDEPFFEDWLPIIETQLSRLDKLYDLDSGFIHKPRENKEINTQLIK